MTKTETHTIQITLSAPVRIATTTTWIVTADDTTIGTVTTDTETGTYTATVNGHEIEDTYTSRREAITAVTVTATRSAAL